jgi:hypothetical protein
MISYQEDSLGIVNDWMESMAPSSSDVPSGARQPSNNNDPLHLVATTNELKSGLGYKTSKKEDKTKIDHVSKMIEKQQKAAKRKQEQALINDQRDLHGIIEDDVEESKTALVSNKTKPNANNKAINSKPNGKDNKAKAGNTNNKDSYKSTATTTTADSKADTAIESIFSIGSTSENTFYSADGGNSEKPYKKRKKTRSKQKNIRRDNRPDTARPEHLQLGSQEYRGRQLTEETRAVLGIEKPEKKPSKHSNKHNHHQKKNNNHHNSKKGDNQSKGNGNQSNGEAVQKKQKVE